MERMITMAKYIDADKLKKAFDQTSAREDGYYPNNVVDSIPAVDAVEVVWCAECKHLVQYDGIVGTGVYECERLKTIRIIIL